MRIADLLQPLVKAKMDGKWFNSRSALNLEKALFLPKNEKFMADIADTKIMFSVPKLNPKKDYIFINSLDTPIEDSHWLSGKSTKFINQWEKHLKELVFKYKLPISFIDWIEWEILYGNPKFYPHYNVEALLEIIKNPNEANRIGLTASEKEFFLAYLKFVINSNSGKRKAVLKKSYPLLKNVISKSKNTKRRSRSLKTALKTLGMGKKEVDFDSATRKTIRRKKTSQDLATSIFKDDSGNKSILVRKQKERLLKRNI